MTAIRLAADLLVGQIEIGPPQRRQRRPEPLTSRQPPAADWQVEGSPGRQDGDGIADDGDDAKSSGVDDLGQDRCIKGVVLGAEHEIGRQPSAGDGPLAASSTGAGTASYHKSFLPTFDTAADAAKCIYHIPVLTTKT
jgi:hypothetical protein